MKKLAIVLIFTALLVSGYRFLSQRKKEKKQPVEIIEQEPTLTPTPTKSILEEKGEDLPSSGVSTEEKPTLPPEELEKLIKEFESGK